MVNITLVKLHALIAKFHYTDTDTGPTRARHGHRHGLFCGETPLGPCGSVRVRVRVRVVEFSYYRPSQVEYHIL